LEKALQLSIDSLVSGIQFFFLCHSILNREGRCGLMSAKGGLMMGTKKVGALSSPQKRANSIIGKKIVFVNKILNFFYF
jgi:hypothetical protein